VAGQLAALSPEQVGLVLGVVVRSLREDLHPDGRPLAGYLHGAFADRPRRNAGGAGTCGG
jgi:hypothetical protein